MASWAKACRDHWLPEHRHGALWGLALAMLWAVSSAVFYYKKLSVDCNTRSLKTHIAELGSVSNL